MHVSGTGRPQARAARSNPTPNNYIEFSVNNARKEPTQRSCISDNPPYSNMNNLA